MSYLLPHLHSGFAVDQAILSEEDRVVVMRWGHDYEESCMQVNDLGIWNKHLVHPHSLLC